MNINLSVLNRVSHETLVASDADTVFETIVSIYKEFVDIDDVTPETELNLSEGDYKSFRSRIAQEFNIEVEESVEWKTIGCVQAYVLDKQGQTVGDRLKNNTWNSKEFAVIQQKLDTTLRMLDGYGVSEEGIGSGLLKIFIGTADLFLKVGNTFKTNLFKFYKSLKRSEIRTYWESHMLKCKAVENMTITTVMNEKVPVPTGMVGSYKNSVEYIQSIYTNLDLASYADAIYNELVDIRRQMTRSQDAYKRGFKNTAVSAAMREDNLRKLVANQNKYFTDKNSAPTVAFKSCIGSMNDLTSLRGQLIDMEQYLGNTASLIDKVDNIDVIIGDITGYLTEDSEVDKVFIEQLAQTVRFLATAFDVYGSTVMRQMACEHNLILCYEQLYKKI